MTRHLAGLDANLGRCSEFCFSENTVVRACIDAQNIVMLLTELRHETDGCIMRVSRS